MKSASLFISSQCKKPLALRLHLSPLIKRADQKSVSQSWLTLKRSRPVDKASWQVAGWLFTNWPVKVPLTQGHKFKNLTRKIPTTKRTGIKSTGIKSTGVKSHKTKIAAVEHRSSQALYSLETSMVNALTYRRVYLQKPPNKESHQ